LSDELLVGRARAEGATTADEEEPSLVSTTPDLIRIRPAIRTTRPPPTADPKLVERNLLTLCTQVSVGAGD
jgi:hypothetical protein